jgi:hypothetical protein
LFLSLEEKDPSRWNYVKELWGDKITTEHRKKYPSLDPSLLISLKYTLDESQEK